MTADSDIATTWIAPGREVRVRGFVARDPSGRVWLLPEPGPALCEPSPVGGLLLTGEEIAHGTLEVDVTGAWNEVGVDVARASAWTPSSASAGADFVTEELRSLRERVRRARPSPAAPISEAVSARLLHQLRDHPDVVKVTRLSVAPGTTVLVVAAHPEARVAALMRRAVSDGHVQVVASEWGHDDLDRVGRSLGSLSAGEIISSGQGINRFGVPFRFARTRLPVVIGDGVAPGLLRVASWVRPA